MSEIEWHANGTTYRAKYDQISAKDDTLPEEVRLGAAVIDVLQSVSEWGYLLMTTPQMIRIILRDGYEHIIPLEADTTIRDVVGKTMMFMMYSEFPTRWS